MPPPAPKHKLLDIAAKKRTVFSMGREIKLDGGEITHLKKMGLSGAPVLGKLIDRIQEMEMPSLPETLVGLIEQDYILCSRVNIRLMEDVEKAFFRVNPSCAKELRDAVVPGKRRERERVVPQRRG
ncbi:MAG: hypothetical protein ABJB09_00080 [Verrucomicrobiota bacterium]